MPRSKNKLRVAFVSSYPPRECGIATFTQDLALGVCGADPDIDVKVAAINEAGGLHPYPKEVIARIDQGSLDSYVEAARVLNKSNIDVVNWTWL